MTSRASNRSASEPARSRQICDILFAGIARGRPGKGGRGVKRRLADGTERAPGASQDPREGQQMNKLKLCVACAPVLAALALAPAASAWAPAATAAVHPGVQTFTQGGQCTSNFIFQSGSNVYIGQAAHCSGTGGNTATDGCTSGTLPVGTKVDVTGASKQGTMVYNSWATMQGLHEANADTCAFNDLALVQLDPADVPNVNPSV